MTTPEFTPLDEESPIESDLLPFMTQKIKGLEASNLRLRVALAFVGVIALFFTYTYFATPEPPPEPKIPTLLLEPGQWSELTNHVPPVADGSVLLKVRMKRQ